MTWIQPPRDWKSFGWHVDFRDAPGFRFSEEIDPEDGFPRFETCDWCVGDGPEYPPALLARLEQRRRA